jgi:hypothetical protein
MRFGTSLLVACSIIAPRLASANEPPFQVNKVAAIVQTVYGQPRVVVQITNNSERALEAWELRLAYVDADGAASTVDVAVDTYAAIDGPSASTSGPIAPGVSRRTHIGIGAMAQSASVELRMVVYSDLSVEGDQEAVARAFVQRERDARTIDLLLGALKQAAGRGPGEGRAFVRNGLSARGAELDQLSAAQSSATSLAETVNELLNAPDAEFGARLAYTQQRFATQRALALRHRGRQ